MLLPLWTALADLTILPWALSEVALLVVVLGGEGLLQVAGQALGERFHQFGDLVHLLWCIAPREPFAHLL